MWNDKPDGYLIPARNPTGTGVGMNFYPWVWVQVRISTHSLFTDGRVIALPDPNLTRCHPYCEVFNSFTAISLWFFSWPVSLHHVLAFCARAHLTSSLVHARICLLSATVMHLTCFDSCRWKLVLFLSHQIQGSSFLNSSSYFCGSFSITSVRCLMKCLWGSELLCWSVFVAVGSLGA
jgi:hypothetical protein